MEVVVPAGQDTATRADLDAAVGAMREYTLRALFLALAPLHLGMLGMAVGVAGLRLTG